MTGPSPSKECPCRVNVSSLERPPETGRTWKNEQIGRSLASRCWRRRSVHVIKRARTVPQTDRLLGRHRGLSSVARRNIPTSSASGQAERRHAARMVGPPEPTRRSVPLLIPDHLGLDGVDRRWRGRRCRRCGDPGPVAHDPWSISCSMDHRQLAQVFNIRSNWLLVRLRAASSWAIT